MKVSARPPRPSAASAPVVIQVFGKRESQAHHRGGDDPVDHAVEFVIPRRVDANQDDVVQAFLDKRGRHHRAHLLSDGGVHGFVDRARQQHGHRGAPEKRHGQHAPRFRLEPVQPEGPGDVDRPGQNRHHRADGQGGPTHCGCRRDPHQSRQQAQPHEGSALMPRATRGSCRTGARCRNLGAQQLHHGLQFILDDEETEADRPGWLPALS